MQDQVNSSNTWRGFDDRFGILVDSKVEKSCMVVMDLPYSSLAAGYINGSGGAHTSRTMMLSEIRLLLSACLPTASADEYRTAVVDENVLLKSTRTTQLRTLKILRELYALDPTVLLFRALRDLWESSEEAQPLLALLLAVARDRVLRASSDVIFSTPYGAPITSQMFSHAVTERLPHQYNPGTLSTIGRNVASSWTQAGHVIGHVKKMRAQAKSYPAALTYALLLGHLTGARGDALFETFWADLLDTPVHLLREQAVEASRLGMLEFRSTGNVTDISFRYLLRDGGLAKRTRRKAHS